MHYSYSFLSITTQKKTQLEQYRHLVLIILPVMQATCYRHTKNQFSSTDEQCPLPRAVKNTCENYTVSQKKLDHFYFYCNFVKCWPILIILSLSEREIISAVI